MPTLATALLDGLKDHGAREIFGIPGDFVLPFFKAIEESGILPCYTFSHEPAVGFAADAAARFRSWEMLRAFQPESHFNDLDDWHFADIAKSIGGHGERVTTRAALVAALDSAVERRGQFSLIEVMLARGVTSDTLARFVAGFKAVREKR